MSITDEVIRELNRTLQRMVEYRGADLSGGQTVEHAAAYRASMDLTRALAKWRGAPSYDVTILHDNNAIKNIYGPK